MKISQLLFYSQKSFAYLLILLLPTQLGKHFWPDWSLVNGLRVDYLSPTLYLTDIIILGILISWIIEKIFNSQKPKAKSKNTPVKFLAKFRGQAIKNLKIFWAILLIGGFLAANILLAASPPAAFYKLVKIFEFSLLGFYIAQNQFINCLGLNHGRGLNHDIFFRRFSLCLEAAVIYSSLLAIFQFLNQGSLGGLFWWLGERTFNAGTPGIAQAVINSQLVLRPYATFPHPNVLGGFLVVSLLLLLTDSRNFIRSIPGILAMILAMSLGMIALFLTFSRVAWLVFLFSILGFMFFKLVKKRFFWWLLGASLISLIGLIWIPIQPESIKYRQDLNLAAIKMVQASPLLGVGLNNFLVKLPEFYQEKGPVYFLQPAHNLYLMVAAETGLIGLMGLIWFLILTLRHLILNTKYLSGNAGVAISNRLILMALGAILVLGLFDHYFYTLQQGQLLTALVFGLAWSHSPISDKMEG